MGVLLSAMYHVNQSGRAANCSTPEAASAAVRIGIGAGVPKANPGLCIGLVFTLRLMFGTSKLNAGCMELKPLSFEERGLSNENCGLSAGFEGLIDIGAPSDCFIWSARITCEYTCAQTAAGDCEGQIESAIGDWVCGSEGDCEAAGQCFASCSSVGDVIEWNSWRGSRV